jgi:hypothetical protein
MTESIKKSEDDYVRPDKTYTELLTEEEIKAKLADYVKVDSMEFIRKGTHVRYYSPTKDDPTKLKFCVGGFIKSKHDDYIVFSQNMFGKGKTWSVQKKGAIFYKKMTQIEILQKRVDQLEAENAALKAKVERMKK